MDSEVERRITHSAQSLWWDGIPFEELWHIYLEAVTSKVFGKELEGIFFSRINKFGREGDNVQGYSGARGRRRPTRR
jgi:hypothetical protein